ncbi:MAG: Ku protein [Actinobacteria bacterium]|nr:Ku protein [Actinomycetota bacterium]
MPSAIWSGNIGFGLVSVPVKVVSATKSRDVRFNQLEAETGARIRYRKVSDATGNEVSQEQIVKGYEVAPGQYVVVEDEDLKALAPKASRMIEIEDFVDLDEIDPIFFENPYYLSPEPGAAKAYRLLVEAMTQLRKVAVGRVVMRSKESLVAIRPLDGILCLETMRYADEINSADGVMPDESVPEPTERELEMAKQLIDALTSEFDPTKYEDQYREQLLSLIEAKAAGHEIVAEPMVEDQGKVVDLMAALEASLARAGRGGAAAEEKPAAEKPKKRSRKSA